MSANAGRFPPSLRVPKEGLSLLCPVPLFLRPKRQAAKPNQSVDSRNAKNASEKECVGASFGIPSVPPPHGTFAGMVVCRAGWIGVRD